MNTMVTDLSLRQLRCYLVPEAPLHMPAHNNGST